MSLPRRLSPRAFRAISSWTTPRTFRAPDQSVRAALVVRTDEIGDLAMTVPLLRSMRRQWPEARITLVAAPGPATLVEGTGLVDDVLTWRPIIRGRHTIAGQAQCWFFAWKHLRRNNYDLAVLPRVDLDATGTRYLAAASGAAAVVGFDPLTRPHSPRERAERALLTTPLPVAPSGGHQLDLIAEMMREVGVPDDESRRASSGLDLLSAEEIARCDEMLSPLTSSNQIVVGVALGAGHPKRCWPPERYAQVVNAVQRRHPLGVVLVGGDEDRDSAAIFVSALSEHVPLVNAVGRTSLRGTLAILNRSDLYLGGDTGAVHLASSVATPCVVVSCHPSTGSRSSVNAPNRFGPWAPGSVVIQPATSRVGCRDECLAREAHCINDIDDDAVSAALVSSLEELRTGTLR